MSYYRSQERNRRLKKVYDETRTHCGAGVYYSDKKKRYIKYSPSNKSGYTKYLRRLANRKVRKNKNLLRYGSYRKAYDYWWTLL